MLRISEVNAVGERLLRVEGKLTGVWVGELRTAWRNATRDRPNQPIKVDVSELSFVSSDGERLLLELIREGALFQGGGVYVRHLLSELEARSNQVHDSGETVREYNTETEGLSK